MIYLQPSHVLAFHSCEKEVGLAILNGKDELRPSDNPWDWLGPGIYFWELNPKRALQYGIECADGRQKYRGNINTPFVLGAIIELGNCLNLAEPDSLGVVSEAYVKLENMMLKSSEILPQNRGDNRALDCAVIKYVHKTNRGENLPRYDSVRSLFVEGDPIYKGANFSHRSHLEICVLNPRLIKGYFLPQPTSDFNPNL